ncbi:Protein phosphatase 2C containing protein [Brugia malayi]|uniref:BMA-PDP-1 n=1 Tax=Brugia malayi TaxID=6279 RepID=A0A0I9N7S9_BRUMA|nr:Protein phosphatase 2C containing protein [Brugia malayi]CTP82044.1 BMA-PDP-1 [Brugia malayi]VIO96078.1 Protein phosphatase 2C containing protein [Brugia malayi]
MIQKVQSNVWREVRRHLRASRAYTDAQLRSSEQSCTVADGAVARIDIAHLPANHPTEDYYAAAKCLSSEAFLFGVFDGHGGNSCSRYISTRLFDYISASILKQHIVTDLPIRDRLHWFFTNGDLLDEMYRENHLKNIENFYNEAVSDSTMTTVRKALELSFCACDSDLSTNALDERHSELSKQYTGMVMAGSCAVVAHIRGVNLHVANVGDSAAVLGLYSQGVISAMPLSKPHCVDNADEVQRIRDAHPHSETNNLIVGGRLFGELFPFRAFGDVRYKWSAELQKDILGAKSHSLPYGMDSPPYLSSLPEVLYHKLTPNDHFMVLATDGLWDFLDPDTVVRLVFDHTLGMQTLTSYAPFTGTILSQVHEDLKQRLHRTSKKPLDENSATHLLRHALGGPGEVSAQYLRLIEMLQLPPDVTRRYRDDITIIVIHFNQKYLHHPGMPQGSKIDVSNNFYLE